MNNSIVVEKDKADLNGIWVLKDFKNDRLRN